MRHFVKQKTKSRLHGSGLGALSLCGLLFFTLNASATEPEIPDTPAGRVFAEWLGAHNSGNLTRVESYCKTHESQISPEEMMSFRKMLGEFDLLSIERSEPLSIEFILKERTSGQRAIGKFEVTNADPPREGTTVLQMISSDTSAIGFAVDAATRSRVINAAIARLNDSYLHPETAKKMEKAVRARLKIGKYDSVTNGGSFANFLDDRFMLTVPYAKAINPITKTNWAGTGVEPDVKVSASEALTKACKLALAESTKSSR